MDTVIRNKEVIQSYIFTSAKYNFSIYEKRIFYRLVEACQHSILGETLDHKIQINKNLLGDFIVNMPTSYFLKDEKDENYYLVRQSLKSLRNKTFDYHDKKTGWTSIIGLIEKPKFDKWGMVQFEVNPLIFEAIMDFSKGFRKYELKRAWGFNCPHTMRFYELFSNVKSPLTYSIQELKAMLHLGKGYKQTRDFINKIILPVKKDLDKFSPYSFDIERILTGRQTTSIRFHPVVIKKNIDPELERKEQQKTESWAHHLNKLTVDYLKVNYGFTSVEIKRNLQLWKDFERLFFNHMEILADSRRVCASKKDAKSYLIGTVRTKVETKSKSLS